MTTATVPGTEIDDGLAPPPGEAPVHERRHRRESDRRLAAGTIELRMEAVHGHTRQG